MLVNSRRIHDRASWSMQGISFIGGESDIAPSATTTDELLDIQVAVQPCKFH